MCVTDFYIYKSHSMYSCTACTKLCQEATNRQDKTAIRLSSLGIFQSVLTAVLSHHVGHHRVISRLCEGSETVTEWKSKIITAGPTYGLTGIGARDACESKNWALSRRDWAPRFDCGRLWQKPYLPASKDSFADSIQATPIPIVFWIVNRHDICQQIYATTVFGPKDLRKKKQKSRQNQIRDKTA